MSSKNTADLFSVLGEEILFPPLFYRDVPSLRFELAGENNKSPLARIRKACDRASVILERLFQEANGKVKLILAQNDWKQRDELKGGKNALWSAGFSKKELKHLKSFCYEEDFPPWVDSEEVTEPSFLNCFHMPLRSMEQINNFIWVACSTDYAMKPSLRARIYFWDETSKVLAHPYDDRGMDIVASNKSAIMPYYKSYHDWLLPYDIALMEETFKA